MAPTDVTKATPKVQRNVAKTLENKHSPAAKKTITTKKKIERTPFKNINLVGTRQRTSTVPKMNTANPENNPAPAVPKSVKKPTAKRRPLTAHSGVPIPEKMKALMQKQIKDGSL